MKLSKIKMKIGKSCVGPKFQYLEDREYTIDSEVAEMLVNAGSAYFINDAVIVREYAEEIPPPEPASTIEPEPDVSPKPEPDVKRRKFNPGKSKT